MFRNSTLALLLMSSLFMTGPVEATPILIDSTPPAFTVPPSPWVNPSGQSVITYGFKTSWDGIAWSSEQKYFMYDAINQMDDVLPDQIFTETGDFTMRWADSNFFRDWRDATHTAAGWNLSGTLAVAYKHNNGPWDHTKYPNNEIYFNSTLPWSFRISGVDADKYDFWTIALHEIIHMLASDNHSRDLGFNDPKEVMWPDIDKGERKSLKLSDFAVLTGAGFKVNPAPVRPGPIPEPGSLYLVFVGLLSLVIMSQRLRHHGARHVA